MRNIETMLLKAGKQILTTTLKTALDKTLVEGKQFAEKVSPEDTRAYIGSFETTSAKLVGNSIVGEIKNTDDKATGVEWGWRKSPVTWSKQSGSPVVEFGVGARVFQKTGEFFKQRFISNLKQG